MLPGEVIPYAVWLYLRFPLSLRDVEELLAERAIRVSYETVRCWMGKFGPRSASDLQEPEAPPGRTWQLDEMALCIGGTRSGSADRLTSTGVTLL